jgi:hypothetical protein
MSWIVKQLSIYPSWGIILVMKLLGRLRRSWKDSIMTYHRDTGSKKGRWMDMNQVSIHLMVLAILTSCLYTSWLLCEALSTTHQQDSSCHGSQKTSVLDLESYSATVTSFGSILPFSVSVISVCQHVSNPKGSTPEGTSILLAAHLAPVPVQTTVLYLLSDWYLHTCTNRSLCTSPCTYNSVILTIRLVPADLHQQVNLQHYTL